MRVVLIAAMAFLLLPAAAGSASYDPGGFGCLFPINNLFEDQALSRYYFNSAERVYRLKVYLNEPAPAGTGIYDDEGVAVGRGSPQKYQLAVCKVVPPHLESLRQTIYWREIGVPTGQNSAVYKSLDIREAGTGGTMFDWLVFRPKSTSVSGVAVIEFHVYTGYSSQAQ